MRKEQIIELLKREPGLSDREITDRILGPDHPQQPIFAVTRELVRSGQIVRLKRPDRIFGNYLVDDVDQSMLLGLNPRESKQRPVLPPEVVDQLKKAGVSWAQANDRPRINPDIKARWSAVIQEWSEAPEMPLTVRKSTGATRGAVVRHSASQREIILADNSPAQWVFHCALNGHCYSLNEVLLKLSNHELPIAFAATKAQIAQMKYGGILARSGVDLNKEGWKLCHIKGVSSRSTTKPENDAIEDVRDHFVRLMDPANHFVVPKDWSGFGELREVIEAIKEYEQNQSLNP